MINVELIGAFAAILTSASFAPQAIKTIRSGETAAISLTMYAMFSAGVALWLAYGLMLESRPIIAANLVTLALAGTILFIKLRAVVRERRRATLGK